MSFFGNTDRNNSSIMFGGIKPDYGYGYEGLPNVSGGMTSPAPDGQSWWSKLLGDPNSSQRMNMFRAGSAAAGMAEDAMARQKALEEQRMQRAQWLAANANTMAQNRIQNNRGYRGLAALGGE